MLAQYMAGSIMLCR